jgi:GH15 family glucan-1,4-alpha-glucosidase
MADPEDPKVPTLKIEDYALIGDCETAALVGKNGSIDWLCWPSFCSGACFAALLGDQENGYWQIAPANPATRVTRKYRDHTLILETTFESSDGIFTLIDFMPLRGRHSDIVRIVRGVKGQPSVHMELALRFDYGRTIPWVSRFDGGIQAIAGPDMAVFRTSVEHHGEDMKTVSDFTIDEGESISFLLTYGASHEAPPRPIDAEKALKETQSFWTKWTGQGKTAGPYSEAIERSLITLKALTYKPTGGIVAAVTTSLPEFLGGQRNWDYRYCWLRDATFTLLAFMNGGYYEEAKAWKEWLRRAVAGSPDQLQIMYGISGERHLLEWEIPWLAGYEASKPVRIGNAASVQVQLDVYGELLDAYLHAEIGMDGGDADSFKLPQNIVEHLETIWNQPDQGIWETRGEAKQFSYSKVMAWVAFDRAIRAAEHFGCAAPVERWKKVRDEIHNEVCDKAFDAKIGSFTESYGPNAEPGALDASLLLIPIVGFLPAGDKRVIGTVEAIEKHLMPDGLVLRYDTSKVDDGLPPGEGVFLACSFWMVSALQRIGREEDARKLFDRLLALRNDVGLLSEEYDPQQKRLVGNFPQALSHIALVNAAFNLQGDGQIHHRAPGFKKTDAAPRQKISA